MNRLSQNLDLLAIVILALVLGTANAPRIGERIALRIGDRVAPRIEQRIEQRILPRLRDRIVDANMERRPRLMRIHQLERLMCARPGQR